MHAWTYPGADVPEPGNEAIRLNLWLILGHPPDGDAGAEVVVTGFEWSALGQEIM